MSETVNTKKVVRKTPWGFQTVFARASLLEGCIPRLLTVCYGYWFVMDCVKAVAVEVGRLAQAWPRCMTACV